MVGNGSFEVPQLEGGMQQQIFEGVYEPWEPRLNYIVEILRDLHGPASHGRQYASIDRVAKEAPPLLEQVIEGMVADGIYLL
jgi:hypothetical protein